TPAPEVVPAVRAIGLSGQMHGAVLLDAAGEVLRPAILWNDGRAADACVELEAAVPASRRITGNLAMPGFTAPKLLWLRRHEPQIFAATRTVLLPKDWLRWRMAGEAISDMSDASGTLWLDVAAGRWHLMAVMLSAASALSWATRLTGARNEGELSAAAATLDAARRQRAPLFLPYLGGERTPHNDAQASAMLAGLRHEHDSADIGYAVMEGVAFGLADGLAAMHEGATDAPTGPLSLVGGGARSDAWAQLIASALGRTLMRQADAHAAAAVGAARLAWLADGGTESVV